ncbi:MAG: LysR family transcriptional regulator [Verrucomicrobiota bacterium]
MEDPELRVLANFVTIAESPSLASAAKKLGLSQPAVTRQIQNLESRFGAALLKRRSSGVLLTHFGERILGRASDFVHEFEDLVQTAQAQARAQRHELKVGSDFAPFASVLVASEESALHEHPGLRLQHHDISPTNSIDALLDRQIDLLATSRNPTPQQYELLHNELWMLRGVTAIIPDDHPLSAMPRLNISDFDRVPVVVPSDMAHPGFLRDIRGAFSRAGLNLNVAQIASSDMTLMNYANYGLGIALVVGLVESVNKKSLVCRPVGGINVTKPRRLEVLWRSEDDSNEDIQALRRHIGSSLDQFISSSQQHGVSVSSTRMAG